MYNLPYKREYGHPKKWLYENGYKDERTHAKVFDFGIPYGSGDFGMWMSMIEAGVECTLDQVKDWKGGFFQKYSRLKDYFEEQAARVHDPGYIDNPFGARKHLYEVDNSSALAAQKREARNWAIQSTVGYLMGYAMIDIYNKKKSRGLESKMVLELHDGLYTEIPFNEIEEMVEVIREGMSIRIPVIDVVLDIELTPYLKWNVAPTKEELIEHGADKETAEFILNLS